MATKAGLGWNSHRIDAARVAVEIIRRGKAADFVAGHSVLSRDGLHEAVRQAVLADMRAMNEQTFRVKYVNFIRSSWGIGSRG